MPTIGSCIVCEHPQHEAIDAALRAGVSFVRLSREYAPGPYHYTFKNHHDRCLGLAARGWPKCTICTHPERERINEMVSAGASYLAIGNLFGLNRATIGDHARRHLNVGPKFVVRCPACLHERHGEINRLLISGEPLAGVGRRFGIEPKKLGAHVRKHLRPLIQAERDDVIASVMEAEFAQRRAIGRLRAFMARPGSETGPEAATLVESSRPVLKRRILEAEKLMALGETIAKQGRDAKAAGEAALQDLERADTELARRKVAREITGRRQTG